MRKLSTEIRPELLAELRLLAAAEERQLESVVDEALTDWVMKRRDNTAEVLARAGSPDERRRKLYEELAHWANVSRL